MKPAWLRALRSLPVSAGLVATAAQGLRLRYQESHRAGTEMKFHAKSFSLLATPEITDAGSATRSSLASARNSCLISGHVAPSGHLGVSGVLAPHTFAAYLSNWELVILLGPGCSLIDIVHIFTFSLKGKRMG